MDRREFLKILTLFAASSLLGVSQKKTSEKIIVVGAGIIGTTIAYELSKAGAKVTLIDKKFPGAQASGNSFSWINATYPKLPYNYNLLSQLGIEAYKSLSKEVNLKIKWSGSLEWFENDNNESDAFKKLNKLLSFEKYTPVEIIKDNEARTLESNIVFSKGKKIIYSKSDGAIDTDAAISELINEIKKMGGNILFPCEYKSSNVSMGRLLSVNTSIGEIQATKIIFAGGIDSNSLIKKKVLKEPTPGIIMKSKPFRNTINRMIVGPGIHLHQQNDGVIYFGEQDGAPASHYNRLVNRPNSFPDTYKKQHIQNMLNKTMNFVNDISDLEIEKISVGWRPLPLDGLPVIGWLSGQKDSYIATMHSGISLGAIVGKLVTQEVLYGSDSRLLKDFRPARFF